MKTSRLALACLFLIPACGSAPDDTAQIQAAIAEDNGGFSMEAEAPQFGEPAEFAAAETENPLTADDTTAADQLATAAGDTDPCGRALALGRWHDVAADLGVFRGRIITRDGVAGHLKGVY